MNQMREDLIAPCGMNCRCCSAFQRVKNSCLGCRNEKTITYATKGSRECIIKTCPKNQEGTQFCFNCDAFPCRRLNDLNKRYQAKYHMNFIQNLIFIKENGVAAFLENEEERWKCPECGSVMCVHKHQCNRCGVKIMDQHR
ncbi:MAG: hypothetical protein CVU96_07245 [Firmicutes bacterium HGW-Firmicutes-20]|nr:MAG: hypothetical protein CVU96_07245 [Firmicutes bacterium HGW-Firmicutes-20]